MGKKVKWLGTLACVGLAASVLGLAGCRSSGHGQTSIQSQADRQLAVDVAQNLNRASATTMPNVAVSAHQGRVQLRGYVADETQKAEAERIAAQVPGVRQVENDLSVRPGSAPVGGATTPGGSTEYPQYPQ